MHRHLLLALSCLFISAFFIGSHARTALADENAVKQALSARHMELTGPQLEQLAGGKEALIDQLLVLRHDNQTPFVGVRAVKLLLPYAEDARVQRSLNDDLTSSEFKGLAQAIALNLVASSNGESRKALAQTALERSITDKTFAPFVEPIKSSQDPEMKRLVKDVMSAASGN